METQNTNNAKVIFLKKKKSTNENNSSVYTHLLEKEIVPVMRYKK